MLPMIARRDAAQAAVDRFDGQPFVWGKNDCVRLSAFVLRKLGHKPNLARAGSYSSLLGAKRALARTGFASLEAALDALGLPRIPPAAATTGDIVGLPGEGDWTALTVAVGNGRVLGFMEGRGGIMQPVTTVTAWRVNPCRKP